MANPRGPDDGYVVQVYFDCADTPVWYGGALEWEDMHLSSDLRTALDTFNRHPSRIAAGELAAEQLAAAIGAPFVVDLRNQDLSPRRRFSTDEPGTHEPTASAFRAMRERDLEEAQSAAAFRAAHPDADWYHGDHR